MTVKENISQKIIQKYNQVVNLYNQNENLIKQIFLYTFCFGIFAHGFAFANSKFSGDELSTIYQYNDVAWKISLGRYGQILNFFIRGYIVAPWLLGVLSLIFLSLAIFVIIKLTGIKSKINIILLCGLLSTSIPLVITVSACMHEIDTFMLGVLITVCSIYIIEKFKYGMIISIPLLSLSISMYQSNLQVAIIMIIIIFIKNILDDKYEKLSLLFKEICKYLFFGIASTIIYYIGYKAVLMITGINAASDYNSVESINGLLVNGGIIECLFDTIKYVVTFFVFPLCHRTIGIYILGIFNIFLILYTLLIIVNIIHKNKTCIGVRVILAMLILIIPLGINITSLLSQGINHEVKSFSFTLIYVLIIMVIEKNDMHLSDFKKILSSLCVISISLILIFNNIVYANQYYLKKDLEATATMSFMTKVVDRIEQVEGYELGETPVAIYGIPYTQVVDRIGFQHLHSFGSAYAFSMRWHSFEEYFEYILGYNINLVDPSVYEENEEVLSMEEFPSEESIKVIDGVIVVKLSDFEY